VLSVPEAPPMLSGATAPMTAPWIDGIATAKPAPATTSGATIRP
jgi:hypothetical protein